MLGLGEEVGRDPERVGGGVGHDHNLGRSGEAIDTHRARNLSLREGHVHIAGARDHVDRTYRLGAVRHRRDRLRAADSIHLVDAGQRRGRKRDRGNRAVGPGRRTQRDLPHPRDAGRSRGHQHARRVRGPPTGDVTTGAVDREHSLGQPDAVALEGEAAGALRRVKCGDFAVRVVERPPDLAAGAGESRGERRGCNAQIVDLGTVEALGELPEGGVAAVSDGRDHLADSVDRARIIGRRSECGREVRHAAEVGPGQHRNVGMVTVRFRAAGRIDARLRGWPPNPPKNRPKTPAHPTAPSSPPCGRRSTSSSGAWWRWPIITTTPPTLR